MSVNHNAIDIERPAATFIAVAAGNSMEGFGIFSGDLLIVDRSALKSDLDIVEDELLA